MGSKKKEQKEKPLDKMTAKELREVALEMKSISGVHGMNKLELLAAIKAARGIEDTNTKKTDSSVRELKKKIKEIKAKRAVALAESNTRMADIYRKRIIRLKKKTRRV